MKRLLIEGNRLPETSQRWRWPLNARGNLALAATVATLITMLSIASC